MIKKITAAMIALIMCAGLAACGNSEEEKEQESKTATTTTAADSAEDSVEDTDGGDDAVTTDGQDVTDDVSADDDSSEQGDMLTGEAAAGMNMRLVKEKNLIVLDNGDLEAQPTDEELEKAIEAALAQYEAAANKDLKAFMASLNLKAVEKPLIEMCKTTYAMEQEDIIAMMENGMPAQYQIVSDAADLLQNVGDQEVIEKMYEAGDNSDVSQLDKLIPQLIDSVTADSEVVKADIGSGTIFRADNAVEPLEERNDSTIYGVMVESCGREGDDVFMNITISMLTENYEFALNQVEIWGVGGEYGAYILDTARNDKSEDLKGITAEDMYNKLQSGSSTEDAAESDSE